MSGSAVCVKKLLELGASYNKRFSKGESLVHIGMLHSMGSRSASITLVSRTEQYAISF